MQNFIGNIAFNIIYAGYAFKLWLVYDVFKEIDVVSYFNLFSHNFKVWRMHLKSPNSSTFHQYKIFWATLNIPAKALG